MTSISPEDAFLLLAKWKEERVTILAELSRPVLQHAGTAMVSSVLPHSRKALLVLRDANGDDVRVTVSLEGAAWAYDDAGSVMAESPGDQPMRRLTATFPNGSRYVFGEGAEPRGGAARPI